MPDCTFVYACRIYRSNDEKSLSFALVMLLRCRVASGVELLSEVDCDADGV